LPADRTLPTLGANITAGAWRTACANLTSSAAKDTITLTNVLQSEFVALIGDGDGVPALITGYYEPEVSGSRVPDAVYRWPLYALPNDASEFDREAISNGALEGRGLEILYLDDPLDAFFLQIQGSGIVRLADGSLARVGYAGNNGREYVAIGKLLVEAGHIAKDNVSLQSIRRYLQAHSEEMQDWLNRNPRYVFFREYQGKGPVGALGTALSPMVSVAVDPRYMALGQPIWLNTKWPANGEGHRSGESLRVLALAEDKGVAIKGQGRVDFFWGAGELAEEMAGNMRNRGSYYPIVPRAWVAQQGWIIGS